MSQFGFIITRHVNSEKTNRYWNQCVKLIRTIYPLRQIVIIDDNSKQEFIKPDYEYKNLTIIQSEYPGRGELLPYVYYLRYKWFPSAVIVHDSLFIHKRIRFDNLKANVMPLWHHRYDAENRSNIIRLMSSLTNNKRLFYKLIQKHQETSVLNFRATMNQGDNFNLCFGCQCFIKLDFLQMLQNKYNITNLLNVVRNRTDRCSLERVLGLLFCEELPYLTKIGSLFGDIMLKPRAFNYNYDQYTNDLKNQKPMTAMVKVWTGR